MEENETISNNNSTGTSETPDFVAVKETGTEPIKPEENRRPNGTFGPGNNANPKGRPKGMSLKQWAKERFYNMSWEDKKTFIEAIPADLVWRMAEGNPAQDNSHTGEVKIIVSNESLNAADTSTKNNSTGSASI